MPMWASLAHRPSCRPRFHARSTSSSPAVPSICPPTAAPEYAHLDGDSGAHSSWLLDTHCRVRHGPAPLRLGHAPHGPRGQHHWRCALLAPDPLQRRRAHRDAHAPTAPPTEVACRRDTRAWGTPGAWSNGQQGTTTVSHGRVDLATDLRERPPPVSGQAPCCPWHARGQGFNPLIIRTWSEAMLGASSCTGCVNEELSREHLDVGVGGVVLYRYGKSMAAYR
jgi:hypothetical protein